MAVGQRGGAKRRPPSISSVVVVKRSPLLYVYFEDNR